MNEWMNEWVSKEESTSVGSMNEKMNAWMEERINK